MTLRQITERFGSEQGLLDWLTARKRLAEVDRLESRNRRDAEALISRRLVFLHVVSHLNALNIKLLQNASRTIAARVIGIGRSSGGTVEDAHKIVHDLISAELREAARASSSGLRLCKTGDNPPPVEKEARAKS